MKVSVEGMSLVVTGGTQGLGETIARLAAESGAAGITIVGRDRGRGEAVRDDLAKAGCPTLFVQADLADVSAPSDIIARAVARFGRVDGLVNAAGLTDRASVESATLDDWDRLFSVNARAPFFLMQAASADMLARKAPGAIVNILSINAHCGAADLTVYSASKGALSTLTRNIANALLPDRIRVNGINMGWAATPGEQIMQGETLRKGPGWLEAAAGAMPLGRLLTADEVARLAIFLLSDASGLMTGALIDMEQSVLGAPPRGPAR